MTLPLVGQELGAFSKDGCRHATRADECRWFSLRIFIANDERGSTATVVRVLCGSSRKRGFRLHGIERLALRESRHRNNFARLLLRRDGKPFGCFALADQLAVMRE